MSPRSRAVPAGPAAPRAGQVIAIPVPSTPAIVPPPPHERAWDVSGAWPAWARYAARQVPAAVVTAVLAGATVLVAVTTPLGGTWPGVAALGVATLIASARPRRALRIYGILRGRPWKAYEASVRRTESTAWIVLQQSRKRANARVISQLTVRGGRRTREEVATPAYEHVWFAGDPNRGGVVVPAGGGPLVYVRTWPGANAPGRNERVGTGVMPVDAVRPTVTQWVLSKVLSPTTRRNLAARAADRRLRREKAARQRAEKLAAARKAALARAQAKQAEWDRTHPERAARRARRVQQEAARRKADRQREAQRQSARAAKQQAKAAKSTVIGTLRARQQAKAMRDNFGRRH